MTMTPVLVAGAGPTGMTMAIELKRAGFDVRIVDKSDHPALHSQALVVTRQRTLEQLHRYGIAEKAVARGRKLKNVTIRSEGKSILSLPLRPDSSRYPFVLFLPQSETEASLNERMESMGVKAERGTELVSFTQDDQTVAALLRHREGHEEEIRPRWIIGCDGAHSRVREQAGIPFAGGGTGLSFFLGDREIEGTGCPD